MGRMSELKIFIPFIGYYETEEDFNRTIEKIDDGYYLNVNRVSTKPGKGETQWISNTLKEVDILTKDEEVDFCNLNRKRKEILKCPTKEYGENLKNLMLNGLVLKYSLWLVQDNQAIYQAQFKYVPNIDYKDIKTDEELLSVCGFTPEEIENMMDYLRNFDFIKNRNNVIRDYIYSDR